MPWSVRPGDVCWRGGTAHGVAHAARPGAPRPGNQPPRPIDGPGARPGVAYAELRRRVIGAGLLRRARRDYLLRGGGALAMFAAAVSLPPLLAPTAAAGAASALAIGFAAVQVAPIGHDAGHLAVFEGTRANRALGSLCWSLANGISAWYWYDRHNRHHASTNDAEDDPDLAGLGIVAHTEEEARRRRGWRRLLTRYQAYLYVLYGPLVSHAFRVEGWLFATRRLSGWRRALEILLLGGSALLWLSPVLVLGVYWLAVYLAGQSVAGLYLALLIAPNHKGMPVWTRSAELSFLERQVLGSRNVAPHPLLDFLFGGLNYQIEHHLFPTMPRAHFRRARAIVKPFCAARGLAYDELGAVASYRVAFAALDRVGRAAS